MVSAALWGVSTLNGQPIDILGPNDFVKSFFL